MCWIEDKIEKLMISTKLKEKLSLSKIKTIKDLWQLKRKDLKNLTFTDQEINELIIALQLEGLDLNREEDYLLKND